MNDFRVHGFDSLSLSKISESTELGKASLYHYFPGGKEQMAQEVMQAAVEWIETEVISVLISNDDPKKRLKLALGRLNDFYECGGKACILEIMIASESPQVAKDMAKEAFEMLIDGFKKLARDANMSSSDAKSVAETAVVNLQGALIVSRGLVDGSVFKRTLVRIESLFY